MSGDTFALIFIIIVCVIYTVPSVIAFSRGHPNRWIILLINIVFGGTVLGWGVALFWALRAFHLDGGESSGGQSGLNLFINDTKKVEVLNSAGLSSSRFAEELERLHQLLLRGAITQPEFDGMKAKLLSDQIQ